MIELIVVLVIYSALILIFVPLDRIASAQTKLKKWIGSLGK